LIGSEDISKLDMYSEGDPRVLDLTGALNVGNRGIVEFIEVFKNETEYLHAMITATQEKNVPAPGRHGMIYVDTCIIAHSNEAEWKKFKSDHTNEAVLDRIVTVKVPYNLRLSEETKIYRKIIRKSGFTADIAPHTIEIASMFAILSRLDPTNKCDLMTKLKLYNGEEVVEKGRTKKIDVNELREEAKNEGMSGISTRFIMKALDSALSDNADQNCIHPIAVREALVNMVKEYDFPDDTKKRYLEFLQDVLHKEYLQVLEREVTKAFVYSYQEQAESLFQNYLDHAEAYLTKKRLKDRNTGEELEPDESFMRSIEEQIAIIGTSADGFRQEVTAYLWSVSRRGESISYESYEPLKEAIEKKLMASVRDVSRIITKARTRDEDQGKKYDRMVEQLIRNGYPASCVDTILKYAANNLWKD
jgi:serine protein kinase